MAIAGLFKKPEAADRFEETFLPHFDAAYNLARWLTRDPTDAEDVVQEAYMRAFKFFSGFHGGDSRSWVLRIVRNTCYSWLQKNRPREIVYELDEDVGETESHNPETAMIENVERQTLKRLLEELPASFREIIVLRDIEEMTGSETAQCLQITEETVKTRLHRARRLLRSRLERTVGAAMDTAFAFGSRRCDRITEMAMARITKLSTPSAR